MITFHGISLASGYADGKAFVYGPRDPGNVPAYTLDHADVEGELNRFNLALRHSILDLEAVKARVLLEIGETESGIFASHLALLQDPMFVENVKRKVAEERINVEQAIGQEIAKLEKLLLQVKSEYIRERTQDIRDVGLRVLEKLRLPGTERVSALSSVPKSTVVVARELFPSDTMDLNREAVVAIVTERSGASSHAVILARSLGVPLVTGISNLLDTVQPGNRILVDGKTATVTVSPNRARITSFRRAQSRYSTFVEEILQEIPQECVTRDGTRISLMGNIGRAEEAYEIPEFFLDGVGLFRTEFLFLESRKPPGLRMHLSAYHRVRRLVGNLPVTIRTLDLGGDKIPVFLEQEFQLNPQMGARGLRYFLAHRRMFLTQIRAILRAAQEGPVRILFPMVVGCEDFQQALEVVHLAAEKEGVNDLPPVGVMIETPASVFEIKELTAMADFISIGTNDLTQFVLAADRNSFGMIDEFTVLHPAVLRALHLIISAATETRCELSVCGEAAGNPGIAALLVGLGVRTLSMSAVRAPAVQHLLRSMTLAELRGQADELLTYRETSRIREHVRRMGTPF